MKKFLAMVLACLMTLSLVACGQSAEENATPNAGTSGEAPACTTIKFNFSKSTSDVTYQWWSDVFDEINARSNNTVKFEIYPSEALGSIADSIEMASKGEAIMADGDLAYLENYVPDLSVGMAPYLMQKPEDIQKFWESDVGQRLFGDLEAKGLKCISMSYYGTRELMSAKEVHSREDIGKLKVRCASTKMWNEVVRVLGGNATNTAWSEVYQAISQGVADACESPLAALYSSKLQESCKYVINTDHCIASTVLVMSADVYNNLPEQARTAIDEVMHEYCNKAIENVNAATAEVKQKMMDEGVTFIDVDKAPFIAAAQETPTHFPEWSAGLYEEVKTTLGY